MILFNAYEFYKQFKQDIKQLELERIIFPRQW